jgi:hypothetical protein
VENAKLKILYKYNLEVFQNIFGKKRTLLYDLGGCFQEDFAL